MPIFELTATWTEKRRVELREHLKMIAAERECLNTEVREFRKRFLAFVGVAGLVYRDVQGGQRLALDAQQHEYHVRQDRIDAMRNSALQELCDLAK